MPSIDQNEIVAGIFSRDKQKIISAKVIEGMIESLTISYRHDVSENLLDSPNQINKNDLSNQKANQETISNNLNPIEETPPLNANKESTKSINSIVLGEDKQTIFVGSDSGSIHKLEIQKDTEWQTIQEDAHQGTVIALDFHPQKKQLISLGFNKGTTVAEDNYLLKLLDQNGNLIKTFANENKNKLTAVSFAPSGDKLITGSNNGKIELWDINSSDDSQTTTIVDSNQENRRWKINAIKFSPDSKLIATASSLNTGNNNDLKTPTKVELYTIDGELLSTFELNNSTIVNVDFSEDGKTILAIDSLGQVKSWNLDLEILIKRGCNWLQNDYLLNTINKEKIEDICKQL